VTWEQVLQDVHAYVHVHLLKADALLTTAISSHQARMCAACDCCVFPTLATCTALIVYGFLKLWLVLEVCPGPKLSPGVVVPISIVTDWMVLPCAHTPCARQANCVLQTWF
jgi:hypothetical protein